MIVSFYTERTEFYCLAADRMRRDCAVRGIQNDIQPAREQLQYEPDTKAARQFVQQQKPDFIRSMLELHRKPVWWLDVDTVVTNHPPAISSNCFFAAHEQPHKPKYAIMSSVLYFSPSGDAFKFLADWKKQLRQGMSDHTPLVMVFKRWWLRPAAAGMFLSNFNDWVRYNGFNSAANPHPVHEDRRTTDPIIK